MAKKPDRPIGAIIFPRSGPVRREFEHLPREQKPLELTVGQKFVGAMSHFGYAELCDLQLGEEPADLFCTDAAMNIVGIQVTEMVDEFGVKLNAHRKSYIEALAERCAVTLKMFSGCALQILDDGTEDFFPSLNSPEGQAALQDLENQLNDLAQEIDKLEVTKLRVRKWAIDTLDKTVSVCCQRHAEPNPETGYIISWGQQRVFKDEEMKTILSDTIRNKIGKHYASPEHDFWLLVYTTDLLVAINDESIRLAAKLLDENDHPFDSVYAFFPYHDKDLGHIVSVWTKV